MASQDFYQMGEGLGYVGTYTNALGQYSSMQLNQDVNASMGNVTFDDDLWTTDFNPFTTPAITHTMADDDIRPIKRVDSDLNPRAKAFTPQEIRPLARTNTLRQLQMLTPLNTNVFPIQSAPYSAPPLESYQANGAVSPMLTLTNDFSQLSSGVQWPWSVPPSHDVNTWTQYSAYSAGGLDTNCLNPALLTPVSQCGSSVRSRSRSVNSAGPYCCDHPGCTKSFKTKAESSHHQRNHGARKHDCHTCHKKFVFKKDLTRHIKIHNPDEREFHCSVAGCPYEVKGFQRKDHHDRHLKTHEARGEYPLTPATTSAPMSRVPSYQ